MPKKVKRTKENPEFFGMLRRMVRAAGKRAGNGDEHDLADLLSIKHEVEKAIISAAKAQIRDQDRSWAFIGSALGMTRQAAHKRFSSVSCTDLE